jgi:hypothetical protein
VTTEQRLEALEAALSPTERIVRWLGEAHASGGLEAYVRSLVDDPTALPPVDQLARAAAEGAKRSLRGQPRDEIANAVDTAIRETVFRFQLVVRINTVTHDFFDRQLLFDGLFSARLALLSSEGRERRHRDPAYLERFAELRGLILGRLAELEAHEQARRSAEERYLAGHPALFPDDTTAWDEQRTTSEHIGELAVALAEKDGLPIPERPEPGALAPRVAQLLADLVEPARVAALEQLGDGWRAPGIATRWVRGKLAVEPAASGAIALESTTKSG